MKSATAPREQELFNDVGNAKRFARLHGENIRFVPGLGWFIWNGVRWSKDQDGAIYRLAVQTTEAMFDEAKSLDGDDRAKLRKHALASGGEQRLGAMVRLAEIELGIVMLPHALDADPWLLGIPNGVIDLRTGTFRDGRRDDYVTVCAGAAYDPVATCPNWQQFLGLIFEGDQELIAYIQRACGYMLTGSPREEVLFLLTGIGSNGKSTFRQALHELMGGYAVAAGADILMRPTRGANPDVLQLKGKRLLLLCHERIWVAVWRCVV